MMRNEIAQEKIEAHLMSFFDIIISSPTLIIFTIIIFLYFIYFFLYINLDPNISLSDKLGYLSILIALLSIYYAVYSTVSTTRELNKAQKGLRDIQTDYWNTRGIDLYHQKKYQEADQSYERADNINPKDAKIWVNRAVSLYEQSKLDEAIDAINKAIEFDSGRADAWNTKGLIILLQAINASGKNIELNPELTEVYPNKYLVPFTQSVTVLGEHTELNNEAIGAWNSKGEALYAQSVLALKRAIDLKTKELTNNPSRHNEFWLAGYLSNLGRVLYSQNKYNESIETLDKAIGLDPKQFFAWFNKGNALRHSGKLSEAIRAFDKAIELDPKNKEAWCDKGLTLIDIAHASVERGAEAVYDMAIHAFDKAYVFSCSTSA